MPRFLRPSPLSKSPSSLSSSSNDDDEPIIGSSRGPPSPWRGGYDDDDGGACDGSIVALPRDFAGPLTTATQLYGYGADSAPRLAVEPRLGGDAVADDPVGDCRVGGRAVVVDASKREMPAANDNRRSVPKTPTTAGSASIGATNEPRRDIVAAGVTMEDPRRGGNPPAGAATFEPCRENLPDDDCRFPSN